MSRQPLWIRFAPLLAAIAVLLIAAALVSLKAYRIPTSAMEPTLRCARPAPGCTARSSDRVVAVRLFGRDNVSAILVARYWPPSRIGFP